MKRQVLVSVLMLAAAATVLAAFSLGSPKNAASGAMQGHNHAAMSGGADDQAQPVHLDAATARRIGVTYARASRRPFRQVVRVVGNVTYDETRLVDVSPKIDGWAERLYVDFTGSQVRKGEPLLDIYSPKLVTAQEELILARNLAAAADTQSGNGPNGGRTRQNADALLESARRRLGYWDIPQDEIARVEAAGEPAKTLTLRAPASGVVVTKNVVEGGRITPGANVYQIADLSRVWVEGEVFEKDLSLVRSGQHAAVSFDAYPGQPFDGTVTYIYPTVSLESRTGRVRIEVPNPDLRLKPGMYAEVRIDALVDTAALLVPRTAVLFTGERAVVFVRAPDGHMLEPREVTPGLRNDHEIQVLAGLAEGDVVVSSASFLIDAESNLGASMGAMAGMDMGNQPGKARDGQASDSMKSMEPDSGAARGGAMKMDAPTRKHH